MVVVLFLLLLVVSFRRTMHGYVGLSMAGSHIYISENNILSQLCRSHNPSARIEWTMPNTTQSVLCHQWEAMLRFLQSFQNRLPYNKTADNSKMTRLWVSTPQYKYCAAPLYQYPRKPRTEKSALTPNAVSPCPAPQYTKPSVRNITISRVTTAPMGATSGTATCASASRIRFQYSRRLSS